MFGLNDLILELHRFQEIGDKNNIVKTLFKLSKFHYDNFNFDKSELLLNDIKKIDEKTENLNYSYALIQIQKKDYTNARKYLNKELSFFPNDSKSKILLEKLTVNKNFPMMTFMFVILLIVVHIFIAGVNEMSFENLIKFSASLKSFTFFSIFTSIFTHLNLLHLVVNIITLVMFGLILEKKIGSLKFLIIFLISGFLGNLSQVFLGSNDFTIGASGAIFGVMGAVMIIQPLLKMRIFGMFDAPIILVLGFFFLLNTLINIMFGKVVITGDISHIIGLFVGILIMILYNKNYFKYFYNWIMISMGVTLIDYIINGLWLKSIVLINLVIYFVIFLIAIFLIFYSYSLLKEVENFGVGNDGN